MMVQNQLITLRFSYLAHDLFTMVASAHWMAAGFVWHKNRRDTSFLTIMTLFRVVGGVHGLGLCQRTRG